MITIVRHFLVLLVLSAATMSGATDALVVHEWGTFTSLQDENGNAIGGINTDDEPVPQFVHDIANHLLMPHTEAPPSFFQGAPSCHPDVTMRLETPVIYFYPPADFDDQFSVWAEFHGGWLTQYFPIATATAPGVSASRFERLRSDTIGELMWGKVSLDWSSGGPATDARVWLAPRQVNSATVTVLGDREKFLFYRGVGHVDAPVRVAQSESELMISKSIDDAIPELLLVDVRKTGTAFRVLESGGAFPVRCPATFEAEEYLPDGIDRLRAHLKDQLQTAGLFQDEAEALLNTWETSYFKSEGLRLFFLVPRSWTDSVLPLSIFSPGDCSCQKINHVPAKDIKAAITRVMVGRIEIVSPQQRALLAKIAAGPAPDSYRGFRDQIDARLSNPAHQQDWIDLDNGKTTFSALGIAVPELYGNYLQLGRFRNALILDEQKRRPTPALDQFIKNFGLAGYKY